MRKKGCLLFVVVAVLSACSEYDAFEAIGGPGPGSVGAAAADGAADGDVEGDATVGGVADAGTDGADGGVEASAAVQ
jgi:hypothetical protein